MANKRIKDLSTTAAVTASDDFIAVDGATNGTRKLDAYSPTFGGNLTVSGTGGVTLSYASGGPTAPVLSFASAGGALGFYQSSNTIYFTSASVRTLGFTSTGLQMSINGSATNPNIATDAVGSTGFFAPANNSLGVTLAGAEVARFAVTTGNLLLGTTTDGGQKLQVAGSATFAGAITTTGSAANMLEVTSSSTNATNFNLINSSTGAAAWSIGSAGSASGTGDAAGALYFYQGSGTKFVLAKTTGNATFAGTITPQQAATASAPTYVKGAIYFDTTLNKLRVGGATGWETITST